eukprot:2558666-Rhodomonas_salina.1
MITNSTATRLASMEPWSSESRMLYVAVGKSLVAVREESTLAPTECKSVVCSSRKVFIETDLLLSKEKRTLELQDFCNRLRLENARISMERPSFVDPTPFERE